MVTSCPIFWSFLLLRSSSAADGDSMHHFQIFSVTVQLVQQVLGGDQFLSS